MKWPGKLRAELELRWASVAALCLSLVILILVGRLLELVRRERRVHVRAEHSKRAEEQDLPDESTDQSVWPSNAQALDGREPLQALPTNGPTASMSLSERRAHERANEAEKRVTANKRMLERMERDLANERSGREQAELELRRASSIAGHNNV